MFSGSCPYSLRTGRNSERKNEDNNKMLPKQLLVKAAKHAPSEALGYEEGQVYFSLLTKKEEDLEKEFSYSKKYRIFKTLFDLGALGKIRSEEKDYFTYILLPPGFLYFEDVEQEIIDFLEEIYLKNYSKQIESGFSQTILKNEKTLILFLLKYFMKEKARLLLDEINEAYLGKRIDKIEITRRKDKIMGIIDENLAFQFVRILNRDSYDIIGYLINQEKESKDYLSQAREEMKNFF